MVSRTHDKSDENDAGGCKASRLRDLRSRLQSDFFMYKSEIRRNDSGQAHSLRFGQKRPCRGERRKEMDFVFFFARKKFVVADNLSGRQKNLIIDKLKEINKPMLEKYAAKGANKSIRAMVVGVPNTGKSTLINSLCSAKRAITGNKPGVTRGKQWVSLAEGIELLDTPGAVPPAFQDQQKSVAFGVYRFNKRRRLIS